ncbi:MAG TPA: hypothetical protein VHU87_15245 [Rhizomicrobium sp.]|jgi:hypothetical protein|nr:hypothetical protein [Rhizomicrobium sp.]
MRLALLPITMVLAAGLLAGCSSPGKQGMCPGMAALADASTIHMFRPGAAPDPSNVLYTVRIASVEGTCDIPKGAKSATASFDVHFRATRAPNGEAAGYTVHYFVAVTQSDRVVNKQPFDVQFSFAPGAAVAEFTDTVSSTVIKADKGKYPWDYEILVGLPLTEGDLAYNRTIGRFAQ